MALVKGRELMDNCTYYSRTFSPRDESQNRDLLSSKSHRILSLLEKSFWYQQHRVIEPFFRSKVFSFYQGF